MRLVWFGFCFVVVLAASEKEPVVRVTHGLVKGSWMKATKGRQYAGFEGIPYAKPPVGEDKFRDPQPLKKWKGVHNATEALLDCVQYHPFYQFVTGAEDCLYLNVYSPNLEAKDLPVIVFIHGGSFVYGAGAVYNPDHVMDRDVILVSINYRLGPLGFISTEDEIAPGNVGLKDQVFALQWVKKNIRAFGGDPDAVTLMGVSAGAASVHYHYLSPLSRGLFTKGIAFSGTAFASWAHALKPAEKAKQLASILECPTDSSEEMMDCLNDKTGEDVAYATTKMYDWDMHLFTPFVPSVEPAGTKNAFLTVSPFEATESGQMFEGPLLISVTSEEGLYPAAAFQKTPEMLTELVDNWDDLAGALLQFNDSIPEGKREAVATKIKERYFRKKAIGLKTFSKLVQAVGDRLFVADSGRLAKLHAKHGRQAYLAKYAFRGEKSFYKALSWSDDDYGTGHADDVIHIFKLPFLTSTAADDVRMTRALINMVYSFAINGVPQLAKDGPEWKPVSPNSSKLNYMLISSPKDMAMKASSDFGHISFWDSLGFSDVKKMKKI